MNFGAQRSACKDFTQDALTEGPELTRDCLQQAPPLLALGVRVHVDGALLAVASRGRHYHDIVGYIVAERHDLMMPG